MKTLYEEGIEGHSCYFKDDVSRALIKFKSRFTPKSKDFMEVTMFRPQEIEDYLFEVFGKKLFALHENTGLKHEVKNIKNYPKYVQDADHENTGVKN